MSENNVEEIIEKLRNWGCDIDGAMERFVNDKEMYVDFVNEVTNDDALVTLKDMLEAEKVDLAFDNAHTLKGLYGNMGFTPLYDIVVKIVEPLRNGEMANTKVDYEELVEKNNELKKLIGE